jgi:hypothetical protein
LYPTRGNIWLNKTCNLELTFVQACSDILASHHGSVIVLGRHGNMKVFYSPKGGEITTHGYRVLTSAECTTIVIVELAVTSGM